MAGNDDLFNALNMLQSGAKTLFTQRAISSANDQVQQIKSSELDQTKQRAALQGVANQITTHLASLGTPATTIQEVAGALGPKQYATANAMNMDAQLTGNKQLGAMADAQQNFEEDPLNQRLESQERWKMKSQNADPLKQLQFQALQDNRWQKMQDGLDRRMDGQTSSRGNLAAMQKINNRITNDMTLLDGDMNPQKMAELAKGFDSIISGGAATVAGSEHLLSQDGKYKLAALQQKIESKPVTMDVPEWKQYYRESLQRIQDVNNDILTGAKKDVIMGATGAAKFNPDGYETYAASKGHDVSVDRKSGKITYNGRIGDSAGGSATSKAPATSGADLVAAAAKLNAPKLIPVTVSKDGKLMQVMKDPATGKLYAPE
jgi:hypothetical protein